MFFSLRTESGANTLPTHLGRHERGQPAGAGRTEAGIGSLRRLRKPAGPAFFNRIRVAKWREHTGFLCATSSVVREPDHPFPSMPPCPPPVPTHSAGAPQQPLATGTLVRTYKPRYVFPVPGARCAPKSWWAQDDVCYRASARQGGGIAVYSFDLRRKRTRPAHPAETVPSVSVCDMQSAPPPSQFQPSPDMRPRQARSEA